MEGLLQKFFEKTLKSEKIWLLEIFFVIIRQFEWFFYHPVLNVSGKLCK